MKHVRRKQIRQERSKAYRNITKLKVKIYDQTPLKELYKSGINDCRRNMFLFKLKWTLKKTKKFVTDLVITNKRVMFQKKRQQGKKVTLSMFNLKPQDSKTEQMCRSYKECFNIWTKTTFIKWNNKYNVIPSRIKNIVTNFLKRDDNSGVITGKNLYEK